MAASHAGNEPMLTIAELHGLAQNRLASIERLQGTTSLPPQLPMNAGELGARPAQEPRR